MNYQRVYDQLVQKNHNFSTGEYFETHHKVPVSIGGTDDENNLVNLTAREHYVAHLLLVKIAKGKGDITIYRKLLYAFNCMKWGSVSGKRKFKYNSRLYEKYRAEYSKMRSRMMKTSHNPTMGKIWIHSDILKKSKIWDKQLPLPDGWEPGRVSKEDVEKRREERKRIKEQKREQIVEKYTEMYRDYLQHGLQFIREKYNYDKTGENLGMKFKRYVKEYDSKALRRAVVKMLPEGDRYNSATVHMSADEKKRYFTQVYLFYKDNGFTKTAKKFNWTKTRNSLVWNFRKYVDDYVAVC